jgi:hypothetical protein
MLIDLSREAPEDELEAANRCVIGLVACTDLLVVQF